MTEAGPGRVDDPGGVRSRRPRPRRRRAPWRRPARGDEHGRETRCLATSHGLDRGRAACPSDRLETAGGPQPLGPCRSRVTCPAAAHRRAGHEPPIGDDRATDPRRHGQVQEVADVARGAEGLLPERRDVRVSVDRPGSPRALPIGSANGASAKVAGMFGGRRSRRVASLSGPIGADPERPDRPTVRRGHLVANRWSRRWRRRRSASGTSTARRRGSSARLAMRPSARMTAARVGWPRGRGRARGPLGEEAAQGRGTPRS